MDWCKQPVAEARVCAFTASEPCASIQKVYFSKLPVVKTARVVPLKVRSSHQKIFKDSWWMKK